MFAAMLDEFPGLTTVLAHMGGYCQWPEVVSLVKKHGAERLLEL